MTVVSPTGRIPILLMVRELDLGGSERQATEIAKALDREQFEPHVACFRPGGIRAAELTAAGVPILNVAVKSFHRPGVITAAYRLRQYIDRQGIRLVHTFDVPATLFGVPSARALTNAFVLSSQRAHRDLTPGLTRRLLRVTDRMAHGIVVNCDAVRRQLVEEDGVAPRLIHLSYNGVDTRQFFPLRIRSIAPLHGAPLVIGVVCALRPEKNLDALLDAFADVRTSARGAKLAVVGGGPCLPGLQRRAAALGISADCVFQPSTAEVPDWLRAIDIFVLPSRSEALSNSLMEAMACGCAVVASRVGGNPELVQHGQNGLLFESGSSNGLSTALRELMENVRLRERLGAAAAATIKDRFSLSRAAQRMGEIYSLSLEQHARDKSQPRGNNAAA